MSRQLKILLALLIIAILAVSYLIITSKPSESPITGGGEQVAKVPQKVDLVKLENDYKNNIKETFTNYSSLIENTDFSINQLETIKNQLLDLRVPTKFKDLHLNFVLAIIKMENFLESGDAEEKNNSQQMISEIKVNNPWLN